LLQQVGISNYLVDIVKIGVNLSETKILPNSSG